MTVPLVLNWKKIIKNRKNKLKKEHLFKEFRSDTFIPVKNYNNYFKNKIKLEIISIQCFWTFY